MLRIQLIGLALVSAIAMSAVAAGSASAETVLHLQWLLYHSQSGIHLLLAEPVRGHALGLLLLEDSKILGGPVRIHCHGFATGTVGPHGLDLVEKITLEVLGTHNEILCSFDKNGLCEAGTPPTAEAVHLPWLTELVLGNGGREVRDLALPDPNGPGGALGWKVNCKVGGATVTDECLEEAGHPGSVFMENRLNGVLGTSDKLSPRASCSMGGTGSGTVEGTGLTENPSPTLLLLISPLD